MVRLQRTVFLSEHGIAVPALNDCVEPALRLLQRLRLLRKLALQIRDLLIRVAAGLRFVLQTAQLLLQAADFLRVAGRRGLERVVLLRQPLNRLRHRLGLPVEPVLVLRCSAVDSIYVLNDVFFIKSTDCRTK